MRVLIPTLTAACLLGCNRYDYFIVAGSQQQSFTNDADILFVIDNSGSMAQEAIEVADNIGRFIDVVAAREPVADPSLSEEVDRFVDSILDRTGNLDFRIGITTSDAVSRRGLLVGDPPVLSPAEADVPATFRENFVCEGACVPDPSDLATLTPPLTCPNLTEPNQNCADKLNGVLIKEEPIEAVFLAMCHSIGPEGLSEEALEACGARFWRNDKGDVNPGNPPTPDSGEALTPFTPNDTTNRGWLRRPDPELGVTSVVVPIVITDEGDQSRRTGGTDARSTEYLRLFDLLGYRMSWAVVGPNRTCIPTAGDQRFIDRFLDVVQATNGVFIDIEDPDDGCAPADFGSALERIGSLLLGLADTFPLRSTPVEDTIVVEVNGAYVAKAEATADPTFGTPVYGDGWYYDGKRNVVRLSGDAVPREQALVKVWYLPDASQPTGVAP